MKKGIILISWFFICLTRLNIFLSVQSKADITQVPKPEVSASSYILVEYTNGQVILSQNESQFFNVPLINKMMTVLLACEKSEMDSMITVSKNAVSTPVAELSLEAGNKYMMEDLLYAIMLTPTNDAPIAVAEYIAGDEAKFVNMMNDKCKELNLSDTYFTNVIGLADDEQRTSARDIATFIRYSKTNLKFERFFSTRIRPWVDDEKSIVLTSKNLMFYQYNGVTGGKTGYNNVTKMSCVTAASKDNLQLICVALNSDENMVFKDSISIFDYGFNNFMFDTLVSKNTIIKSDVVEGYDVNLICKNDVMYVRPIGESYISDMDIEIESPLTLPVTVDKSLGRIKYTLMDKDNRVIEVPLFSDREIVKPSGWRDNFLKKLTEDKFLLGMIILFAGIEVILIMQNIFKWLYKLSTKK